MSSWARKARRGFAESIASRIEEHGFVPVTHAYSSAAELTFARREDGIWQELIVTFPTSKVNATVTVTHDSVAGLALRLDKIVGNPADARRAPESTIAGYLFEARFDGAQVRSVPTWWPFWEGYDLTVSLEGLVGTFVGGALPVFEQTRTPAAAVAFARAPGKHNPLTIPIPFALAALVSADQETFAWALNLPDPMPYSKEKIEVLREWQSKGLPDVTEEIQAVRLALSQSATKARKSR